MSYKINKDKKQFMKCVSKLEPEEFIGLCKLMNVDLMNEDMTEPRDSVDILANVFDKFKTYTAIKRSNLLAIVKAATKGKK